MPDLWISLGCAVLGLVILAVALPSVAAWWRLVRGHESPDLTRALERIKELEARLQSERVVKLRATPEPEPMKLEAWALREGWLPPSSSRGVPPDFVRLIRNHASYSLAYLHTDARDEAVASRLMEIIDFADQALRDYASKSDEAEALLRERGIVP